MPPTQPRSQNFLKEKSMNTAEKALPMVTTIAVSRKETIERILWILETSDTLEEALSLVRTTCRVGEQIEKLYNTELRKRLDLPKDYSI